MPDVVVLGSTGSIGRAALRVIDALGEPYRVVALAARNSVTELADQIVRFHPQFASVGSDQSLRELKALLPADCRTELAVDAATQLAALPEADIVLSALVGSVGLEPALAAARSGKRLALANKEALVMAGHLLMDEARRHGCEIVPVDSEHSAIFQCLQCGRRAEVAKVTLTASGGAFFHLSRQQLQDVTPQQALAHPTWNMGPKVTIDSATLMNKALEIVEARWLFDLKADEIEVIIHPQSIIHSMVTFVDGSTIAQMGSPDMQTPIQYALTWPNRLKGLSAAMDLASIGQLTFSQPDLQRFPSLRLGSEVAARGRTTGAVFNAANEVAVEAFRNCRLPFSEIVTIVEQTLNAHQPTGKNDLAAVLEADRWAREEAAKCLNR